MVTLVPDRARRALSIPLITLSPAAPHRPQTQNTAEKRQKKVPVNYGKIWTDSRACVDSKLASTGSRSSLTSSTNSTNHLFI